jgi:hypothetical protein
MALGYEIAWLAVNTFLVSGRADEMDVSEVKPPTVFCRIY